MNFILWCFCCMHVVYSPLKYNLGITEFKILEDLKKPLFVLIGKPTVPTSPKHPNEFTFAKFVIVNCPGVKI